MLWIFLNECPKYIIPDEEIYCGTNYPLICFTIYTYQGSCEKHDMIPNGPSLCKLCEDDYDINNGIVKRPTYRNKKFPLKMSCYIGEFNMVNYYSVLNKYACCRVLICLLVKHECKDFIRQYF